MTAGLPPLPPIQPRPTAGTTARPSAAPRIIISICVAAVVIFGIFLLNNPDFLHRLTGPSFKVGDCATVEPDGLRGSTMKHVNCPSGGGDFSFSDPVYRVDRVQQGKDGSCLGGLSRVTFSDEPENTTYCLSIAGLG